MSYQPQVVVLAASSPGRPISKWWWIGLLISWIIFLIIAGVLVTANCITCSELNASFACFAIAGALHLAFWIVLIVWCTQRRRKHASPQKFIPQPDPAPIYSSPPPQGPPPLRLIPRKWRGFAGTVAWRPPLDSARNVALKSDTVIGINFEIQFSCLF